jgi:copper chaperone
MKAIEGALKNINVTGTVSLENKTVEVDLDKNEVSLTTIREAIENQSFDVQ